METDLLPTAPPPPHLVLGPTALPTPSTAGYTLPVASFISNKNLITEGNSIAIFIWVKWLKSMQ